MIAQQSGLQDTKLEVTLTEYKYMLTDERTEGDLLQG